MAIHEFKYYIHDSYSSCETAESILAKSESLRTLVGDSQNALDDFIQKIGRSFSEVELLCQFDDVTGQVTIVSAKN